ncbi:multidrug/Oligosaccharidyl-lipid/Polysaccharide flippase [Rhizoctonia solani]|nr:multidrug/Oligosaccharidyl-lipid/Polysaccharide flippase [Rhizoctonia solani]
MAESARESEPLLGGTATPKIDETQGNVDETEIKPSWNDRLQEGKVLLQYTAPVYAANMLERFLMTATMVSVGHLSTDALAATALGSTIASMTGWSIAHGFAGGLDGLLPQAWTTEHPQNVGLWTQRMVIAMGLVVIPILVIWNNAEYFLLALSQEPERARLAGIYLRWSSLGLPAYCFNIIIQRYFQAQGLMHVSSRILGIIAPINALLNWLLVLGPQPFRLGFIGAPIATSISFNLISVCSILYGFLYTSGLAWHPIGRRSFQSLGSVFRLGMAGTGQIAAGWWSWEFVGLAASQLGPVPLAAHSILLSSAAISFQAPYSLTASTTVRIGNFLGSGRGKRARTAAEVSLLLSLLFAICVGLVFFIFRVHWGYIFSNDEVVVRLVGDMMPLVAVYQIVDGASVVAGGALRARGKTSLGALITLTTFYVIGIPLGFYLAFSWNMSLYGLWIGLACALCYSAAVSTYVILRTDWVKEALYIGNRVEADKRSRDVVHV